MAAVTLFRCVVFHLGVFWWWGCGVVRVDNVWLRVCV